MRRAKKNSGLSDLKKIHRLKNGAHKKLQSKFYLNVHLQTKEN